MFDLSITGKKMNRLSGVRSILFDIEETMKKAKDKRIYNMSAGNPMVLPEIVNLWKKYTKELLDTDNFCEAICRYGSTVGFDVFIEAMLNLVNKEYNWNMTPQNIAIGSGSQSLSFFVVNCYAGRFEDRIKKVLLPVSPDYTGFDSLPLIENINISYKPTLDIIDNHYFKYRPNFDDLKIDDSIGVVLFSRPTNPTGNVITDDETDRIIQLAKEKNIPVIIDSAYASPIPNIVYTSMKPHMDDNVIHIMSMSKVGLAGERIGIAFAQNQEIIKSIVSFVANLHIHSSRFGQALAAKAIMSGELKKVCNEFINPFYDKKRKLSELAIKESFDDRIPYYIHKGEGTMFLWIWLKDLPITDKELYEILKQKDVVIVPGNPFFVGLEKVEWKHKHECIRISLVASDKDLTEGIEIIGKTLKEIYKT